MQFKKIIIIFILLIPLVNALHANNTAYNTNFYFGSGSHSQSNAENRTSEGMGQSLIGTITAAVHKMEIGLLYLLGALADTTYPLIYDENQSTHPVYSNSNPIFTVQVEDEHISTVIFSFLDYSDDFLTSNWVNFTVTNFIPIAYNNRTYNYTLNSSYLHSTSASYAEPFQWFFWVNDSGNNENQTINHSFYVNPFCGDGICESGETPNTCSPDCGAPSGGTTAGGGSPPSYLIACLKEGELTNDSSRCCSGFAIEGVCVNKTISNILIMPEQLEITSNGVHNISIKNKEEEPIFVSFSVLDEYKQYIIVPGGMFKINSSAKSFFSSFILI